MSILQELKKELKGKTYSYLSEKIKFLKPEYKSPINWEPILKEHKDFRRPYVFFSGVDIKVKFDDEVIGNMQGFSYHEWIDEDGNRKLDGNLVLILFDGPSDYLGKEVQMTAVAANEYGKVATVFDKRIKFKEKAFSVSVDDVISEEHYAFEEVTPKEEK